jgi:hypothetical protein
MILFLDFDGVLHPEPSSNDDLFCRVGLFLEIMRARTEVRVVFSTSWRELYSLEQLQEFVSHGGGEDLRNKFIGTTPVLPEQTCEGAYRRHVECLSFLQKNGLPQMAWLAIDDHADDFPPRCSNLYLTNKTTGLTRSDVGRIILIIESLKR